MCAKAFGLVNSVYYSDSDAYLGDGAVQGLYLIMGILQVFITYTPGLNFTLFSMAAMDARQWGIVLLFAIVVLVVMETEKAVRNYVSEKKYYEEDVDDEIIKDDTPLPAEVKNFGKNEMNH